MADHAKFNGILQNRDSCSERCDERHGGGTAGIGRSQAPVWQSWSCTTTTTPTTTTTIMKTKRRDADAVATGAAEIWSRLESSFTPRLPLAPPP